MRGRSIRLSLVILFILALSGVALAFPSININLPGFPALARGGDGPLGLRLGLDLSGGGQLLYEADTGSRLNLAFAEPEDAARIEAALDSLAVTDYTVTAQDDRSYLIAAGLLPDAVKEGLQPAINAELAAAATGMQLPADNAALVQFEFPEPVQKPDLVSIVSAAADPLELENRVVSLWNREGEVNRIRLATDTPLEDALQEQLRAALAAAVAEEDGEVIELEVVTHTPVNTIVSYELNEILDPTADQMAGVLDIISRRVNQFGTEEPIIQLFGDDRVIVQLPGASGSISAVEFSDPTGIPEVEGVVRGQGFADFTVTPLDNSERRYEIRTVSINVQQQQELREALAGGVGAVNAFATTGGIEAAKALIGQTAQLVFKERTCSDLTCATFTDADLGLTGDDLDDAYAATDPNTGEWEVNISFNQRGSEIFGDLTQRIVGVETKRIAVFLDEELLIAPVSLAWIRDGRSSITGNFSREEASTLAIQLQSGSLPVPLRLIQQSDVDALLGSASLERSLMAGIIGLGLVLVFMVAYYRAAGIVAALALIFYTVIVLAVFKLVPVTLGLSGIGAFILSIGLAVDANILIFERMKEEIRIGRTLSSSMEVGFGRAWPAIRDGNFSTLITCLVLLWLGSRTADDLVTGFAFTLFIGVAASMFTAIVVSRNLLQLSAWLGLGRRIFLFTPEKPPRPNEDNRAAAASPGRARRAEGR